MADDTNEAENKSKGKSRKRYEIPKTATCSVCGKNYNYCQTTEYIFDMCTK